MKLKPLEPGDSVRAKCVVNIHGNDAEVYLDGKLTQYDARAKEWLVEYSLAPVMGASKHQSWWHESDITSKHYISSTDDQLFEKAEKIAASDYTGVLFYDDRYFDFVDELLDWCEDAHHPNFVWACDIAPVKLQLDLEFYVSEQLEEDGYEGLSERSQFEPLFSKLKFIQDNFVAMAAKEMVSYPNYKKAVVL